MSKNGRGNERQEPTAWEKFLSEGEAGISLPGGVGKADWDPLVPNVHLPLGQTATYQTVSITSLPETVSQLSELRGPIDVLAGDATHEADDPPQIVRATAPAEGICLTHQQGWHMKGVTLGRLLHAMSLAPGEVTQVAITSWERKSRGESSEKVAARERSARKIGRDRASHDVTKAVASSTEMGASSTTASSSQADAGIGGVVGLLGGSTSGSANNAAASTVNFSAGDRKAAASANNRIRQATQQHAANVRGRRASLVQEVSQSETEQFRSRVVANYNHTHTLNMLYFEVLQAFELATTVIDAERCIFLPMEEIRFDRANVVAYAQPLAKAAAAVGQLGLAAAIEGLDQLVHRRQLSLTRAKSRIQEHRVSVAQAQEDLKLASRNYQTELAEHRIALTKQKRLVNYRAKVEGFLVEAQKSLRLTHRDANHFQADGVHRAVEALHTQIAKLIERIHEIGEEISDIEQMLRTQDTALSKLNDDVEQHRADLIVVRGKLTDAQTAHQAAQDAEKQVDEDIIRQLNDQRLAFNQALWLQLDPTQVAQMLAGKEHLGQSLIETVDPRPIAVVGNYVGFRWGFPKGEEAAAEAFRQAHMTDDDSRADRDMVVMPTGAVFAEAVAGQANSAEKLDMTRFWNWDENTIPILPTAISSLHQMRRAQRDQVAAREMSKPAVSLQALPDAPAAMGHALASVIGGSIFRDMSGGDVIESLLTEAQKVTGEGSAKAQELAHQNIDAFLTHAETLIPKIAEFVQQQQSAGKSGKTGVAEGEAGSIEANASNLGGLKNALAGGEEGLDVGALLSEAAELGMFL